MSKNLRQPFSPRGPFTVTKTFTWNGKTFERGSDFPHRRMAIDHRRLNNLYDARKLDMKDVPASEGIEVPEDQIDEPIEVGEGQFLFDPEAHSIERDEKEYWITDEENFLVRVYADTGKSLDEVTKPTLVTVEEIIEFAETDEEES